MQHFNIEIPDYSYKLDPTKDKERSLYEWTIQKAYLNQMKRLYDHKCKQKRKKTEVMDEVKKKDIKLE